MHTTATGHPTPEELIAFVDGDTTPEVAGHVQGCMTCSTEASAVSTAQGSLRQALYRFDCPAPHRLGEYELGVVQAEERVRIASHAVECDACASDLQMLRAYLAADVSVPDTLFEQVRRVIATLLVPAPGRALAGVRGAETQMRQYRVDNASLSIGQGPERGTLVGLLLVDDAGYLSGDVRLLSTPGEPRVANLDELGNFEFEGVAPGGYALEIHLPDEIIVVQELRVD